MLSRVEKRLVQEDTLEACVDLDHAPPIDADEPLPITREGAMKEREEQPQKPKMQDVTPEEYHRGNKIKWAINDILQEKAERMTAYVQKLNSRYMVMKKQNRHLANQVSSLKRMNRILRSRCGSAGLPSKSSSGGIISSFPGLADNSALQAELDQLRARLRVCC